MTEREDSRVPILVEDEMKRSYLDYAMSVIVGRALPDVRDGLKPVHRRSLFGMHTTGNQPDKPYRKSARAVGTVIGRFHPHGESAVYDTIVRMAQPFSMRYMLVDGQGNFGSVDGDRPAAMRYTEIKLTKLATQLLKDIDKETVDFVATYDGSEEEPSVLPAAYPNLLVNGSSGIAVGMTTNIPPHNLGEIIDGIKLVVANPAVTLDELMAVIPGPDFPTAGVIHGLVGIRSAYATGRGRLRLRGVADIEDNPHRKNRQMIVVRELPYQVNKSLLIKEMADLVRDKRLEGISDIRDESDRDGIRLVIELKSNENANIVLNQLFKFTKLESTFGVINLAIVNGRPRQLTLKEMLKHFADFRRDVIVRRTTFELKKAEARAHILEGLKIAIDNLDDVVALIRASTSPQEAKEALRLRFHFSDLQAQAILDLRLHRLTGLERQKIVDEYEAMMKLIGELKAILASETLQLKIVIDELEVIRQAHADPRRTQLVATDEEITLEDLIDEEEMVITVTHTGYIKRTPLSTYQSQRRGGKGRIGMKTREEDLVQHVFVASTHDYILVFTSDGLVHWLKVYRIPEVASAARGKPVVNLLQTAPGASVRAMLSVREFAEGRYVVLGTRRGRIKKTQLVDYSRPRAGGIIALNIEEDDDLLGAVMTEGDSELFMATEQGKSIRFKESDVRPMGRTARGVIGIRLSEGDAVVGMEVLSSDKDILTVTRNGYGKRTSVDEYRLQSRGGRGIINIRTSDRNGNVVASMEVVESDHLLVMTTGGKIIRMGVGGISRIGRATQGVRIIDTDDDDHVASAIRTAEDESADDNKPASDEADPDTTVLETDSADSAADATAEDADPDDDSDKE